MVRRWLQADCRRNGSECCRLGKCCRLGGGSGERGAPRGAKREPACFQTRGLRAAVLGAQPGVVPLKRRVAADRLGDEGSEGGRWGLPGARVWSDQHELEMSGCWWAGRGLGGGLGVLREGLVGVLPGACGPCSFMARHQAPRVASLECTVWPPPAGAAARE